MGERIHTDRFRERGPDTKRVSGDSERKPPVKTGSRNPKKGYGHIRKKVTEAELNHFIEEHKDQYPVQKMCEVLAVPRSSYCYYDSLEKTVSKREQENQEITKEIQRIHLESKTRYGAPKIHKALLNSGFYLSLKRVQRLMRKAGIRSITKKKYRPYPSKEKVVQLDNLLMRNFSTHTINEKWAADITYIPTIRDGWCYLASVLDLHSKKIVGFSLSRSMTSELVIEALQNACLSQKPREGLILHTDLGSHILAVSLPSMFKNTGSSSLSARKAAPMTTPV
jgi:putative transposase